MKPKPKRVFVAGTMTDWKSLEMGICAGESDFNFVIDCSPGKYHYKFCVDNDWCIDESQPFASYAKRKNSFGTGSRVTKANVITVKPEDFEVFEALACDSFATRYL
jgi:1,4-alpha-glucan branching enzyme